MLAKKCKYLFIAITAVLLIAFSPFTVCAGQLSGSNGTDVIIPDANGYGTWTGIYLSGAPSGAKVTSVEYRVRVVQVYVWDIELELESPAGSRKVIWYQGTGGATDGGYDDDVDDDNDIYLNWRVESSYFDNENPNGWWYLNAWDLATPDEGYIDYFEIKVNYEDPFSDLQLVESGCYISPSSRYPGGRFTVYYRVYNPNSSGVTFGLGASIRPVSGGSWIDDLAHDTNVSIGGGATSNYSRYFDIPTSSCPGAYTVAWGIHNSSWTGMYDYFERNDLTVYIPSPTMYDITPNPSYDGNYRVSWTDISFADGYELIWSTDPSVPEGSSPGMSIGYNYLDVTGMPAGTWYYKVRAIKCYPGYSSWSNIKSVNVINLIPTRFRGDHFTNKTAKISVPILLEAKLERDTAGNAAIVNETVYFAIYYSGAWHNIGTDITDSNGIASVYYTPPKGFSPGNYSIRAKYNGSGTYAPCELTRTLTIVRPTWILMYYLCNGDDASMDDGLVVKFNTIANNLPNDNIEVFLLSDRRTNTDYVFRMKNDTNVDNYINGIDRWTPSQIGLSGNEFNTGDVNHINAFTDFVISNYEAEHFALIIFDHGAGISPTVMPGTPGNVSISGIGWDTDGNYLSISELGQAIQNVKNRLGVNLDVLHLDACLMQMIEINYEIRNKVDFLVASENEGWYFFAGTSWESYLSGITTNTTPSALSINISTSYFNNQSLSDVGRTISVTNIGDVENVTTAVDNLANVLVTHLGSIRSQVVTARNIVQKFAYFDINNTMTRSNIFIDLLDFCTEIRDNVTVGEVITAANNAINAIGNVGGNFIRFEDHENSPGATSTSGYWFSQGTHGVSIFFPETTISTYRNYINDSSTPANLSFTASTHWDEFLTAYFGEVPPAAPSNLQATAVSPTQIDLVWEDNSDNETEFRIWRRTGTSGPFEWIATMGADNEYFPNTGLLPNTTYQYAVHAHNDFGNSPDSNIATATTPDTVPAAPSNLQASVVSSTQINLTWSDNSNNETGFKIERKTGASGTYTQIGTTSAGITTYQDSPLVPNTDYYYRVRAYNIIGDSLYSNDAHAKTLDTVPAAPTNLQATAVSSTQINLTWSDNSNNETGFKIERKTGPAGTYSQIDTVGAGTVTYQDTQLAPEITYYYKVRAYNAVGDSNYSNEAYATTQPCIVPPQAGGLSPCGGQMVPSPVTLSWNSVNGADLYKVRIFSGENCINFQQEIIVTPPASSIGPITLPDGSYSWHVAAVNSCGETSSSCCNFQVVCPLPAVPTNPSPMNGAASISIDSDLDWDDCADAVSYDVYWGISYPPLYHDSTNQSFYDLPQLEYGTQYHWKIVAKNSCGDTYGADWNFTTEEYAMPHISSLNPTEGPIGTPVTISGSDFGSTQGTVSFNGTNAVITSWTNTEINTKVPSGATTGPVVVHTFSGDDSNGVTFTVTFEPPGNKADLNGDGKEDILWRYYGTGGYNAVWLRGTVTTTASVNGVSSVKLKNNQGMVDITNAEVKVEKGKVLDNADMNISIQELRKQGIIDGFEGSTPDKGDEKNPSYDPFEKESSQGQGVNHTMTTLSDPRDAPEAVELPAAVNTDWKLCGTGDFNGDNKVDLVWRNVVNGNNVVWFMDGVISTGVGWLPATTNLDWTLCGTGDFNGDDKPDLVWRNLVNGNNVVWYMDGLDKTGIGWLPTSVNLDWTLCGTGDFNNDGKTDLVWRNVSNGNNAAWFMDGVTMTSVGWFPATVNLDWTLCGTGDFNDDGKTDLLWRNVSNGNNVVWYMDGLIQIGVEFLTTVTDTTWKIEN